MSISPFFKNIPPKSQGIPSTTKKYRVNCFGNLNTFTTYELVRFQYTNLEWFDPYENYFEIEIEMDQQHFGPYDLLCLDGPSTSLISELIIVVNGQEVERINEHDQISKLVSDFTVTEDAKLQRMHEGYLYNEPQQSQWGTHNVLQPRLVENTDFNVGGDRGYIHSSQKFLNTQNSLVPSSPSVNVWGLNTSNNNQLGVNIPYNNNQSPIDILQAGNFGGEDIERTLLQRGQFLCCYDQMWGIQGSGSLIGYASFTNTVAPVGPYNSDNVGYHRQYSAYVKPDKFSYLCYGNTDSIINGSYFREYQDVSYVAGFKTEFGVVVDRGRGITRKTFVVPLQSAFMGHFIPKDQHRLLPGKWFKQVDISIRLNRYAFYTSGFKNGGELANLGNAYLAGNNTRLSANQQILNRVWSIKKCDFIMQTYSFPPQIESRLHAGLGGQIVINSTEFYQAHRETFAGTNLCEVNIQLNQKHRSIKSLWWWYLLNDYETRPYCKKHYKVSANVTSYQVEVGNNFYPYHKIEGHAGNYIQNSIINDTNLDMYMYFQRALGQAFSADFKSPYNQVNYGINERCWDVTKFDVPYTTWTFDQIRTYGCGQLVNEEQRQGIGGGIYIIPFENIPQSGVQGLNLEESHESLILRVKTDKVNYNMSQVTICIIYNKRK